MKTLMKAWWIDVWWASLQEEGPFPGRASLWDLVVLRREVPKPGLSAQGISSSQTSLWAVLNFVLTVWDPLFFWFTQSQGVWWWLFLSEVCLLQSFKAVAKLHHILGAWSNSRLQGLHQMFPKAALPPAAVIGCCAQGLHVQHPSWIGEDVQKLED